MAAEPSGPAWEPSPELSDAAHGDRRRQCCNLEGLRRKGHERRRFEIPCRLLAGLGYRQLVAVIGDSANTASIALHAGRGFLRVGTLRSVGFKFGRWVDSVIMQRPLGQGDAARPLSR